MPAPRSLLEAAVILMRKRRGTSFPMGTAPQATSPGEDVGGFATDLDAALALRALARRGPDEACLLPRRIVELGLDPDEIARLEPALFRELHWRCTMCESKGECAVDLAGDAVEWTDRNEAWCGYCPNSGPLRLLGEIPWYGGSNR